MKVFEKDKLKVHSFDTRKEMGVFAASEAAECIKRLIGERGNIRMIFAAAPSQNEFLEALISERDIDWSKIDAFHMDEYVGLAADAPQGFGNFLDRAIFSKVPFKSVSYINGQQNPEITCKEYAEKLTSAPIDIVCMGVGENGHIAFNDPPVADFNDKEVIKKVKLDEICRNQQVNDGCFAKLSDVPQYALTLTVPTLMACEYVFCVVPAKTKAQAIFDMLNGEIGEKCPATALRNHNKAKLYLDADSSSLLK